MADTGYNWDASWTSVDAAVVLTQGGTTTDSSDALEIDVKAAALISIDADYSNHVKATGGLFVYLLRETGDGSYETVADGAWGFEMPFTQNGTNRKVFPVDGRYYHKFKIYLDWQNSTASSSVTVRTDIQYATIPVAS